ncbi:hypothetical protein BC830DRAFT_1175903, partial [Chytriomyces sp. MP71]
MGGVADSADSTGGRREAQRGEARRGEAVQPRESALQKLSVARGRDTVLLASSRALDFMAAWKRGWLLPSLTAPASSRIKSRTHPPEGHPFQTHSTFMVAIDREFLKASIEGLAAAIQQPAPGNATGGDPCSIMAAAGIQSVQAVEACYKSFPASAADKKAHIDALKGYWNVYPYNFMARNISAPYYPMSYNFFADLDHIAADASITSEYQLQRAIQAGVAKLEDGHNNYQPLCFNAYSFMQPFVLAPVYGGPTVGIVVDSQTTDSLPGATGDAFNNFWTPTAGGHPLKSFVGATVTSMNGKDPVDFLQTFADRYAGSYHAPETRFNSLFPSYKGVNKTGQGFAFQSTSPGDDNISY